MIPRQHDEPHRQASWLELLFDLAFVVAVAQAAKQLEHALAAGHAGAGVAGYLVVFAAIWWAWMAFTWFANVFDTDDVPYRILMFVMIGGSLGLAAGVPRIAQLDFRIGVASYVVMRLAYVAQWVRVWRTCHASWRPIAARMAILTTFDQIGWVAFLGVPEDWRLAAFVFWFAVDLATPWLAGWDARMGGHRHHIVERYGLFTIIVLGESIAAATIAVSRAIGADVPPLPLLTLGLGGLLVVVSVWWIYFDFTEGLEPARGRRAQYAWAYLHYFVFAALAAVGAGIALCVARMTDPDRVALSDAGVGAVVAVAIATFLVTLAWIERVAAGGVTWIQIAWKILAALATIGAALSAPAIGLPGSVLLIGAILAALVVRGAVVQHRLHARRA